MGTTAEKLYKIIDSKEEIKQALIAKGINITDETTFAEYAEKINEITNGGAITDEEALLFLKDLAEGKRKIAKAVRNKYETITEEESGITEYSTFDELSNKISQIPVEVPLGNAMEQNGGVLPFYDVYNETLKAMKEFAGYGFNGVCAFELDKWSYDNDHKVTLSGADAYYTSDGTFIKDNIIYKNGSQIGEFNGEYQFQDRDLENFNRFIIFFSINERYTVSRCLPTAACLNLWCVKGTPLMSFNADFVLLNSINVYDGELNVNDANDFKFNAISYNQKLRLPHIKEIKNSNYLIYANGTLREVSLPNLTTISGCIYVFLDNAQLRKISLPNLTTVSGSNIFQNNAGLRAISLPNLTTVSGGSNLFYSNKELVEVSLPNLTTISLNVGNSMFVQNAKLQKISLPNLTNINSFGYLINLTASQHFSSIDLSSLKISSSGIVAGQSATVDEVKLDNFEEFNSGGYVFFSRFGKDEVSLPKLHKCTNLISSSTKIKTLHIGDGMRDGTAGNIKIAYDTLSYLTTITVAEGFKAKLDLTSCNGLERDVLVRIINNLADLTSETSLNLIMGSTLLAKLTDTDKAIATDKNWSLS